MKHLQTYTSANYTVVEYETYYSVSIHIVGCDGSSLHGFRVSKKSVKSPYLALLYAVQYSIEHKCI